jgi:hypothetical protein
MYKLLFAIYLKEWKEDGDQEQNRKIRNHLDLWQEFCNKEYLGDSLLKICLIRGLISIITSNFSDAERRFVQCSLTSEEMGLINFRNEIEEELDFLKEKIIVDTNNALSEHGSKYFEKIIKLVEF